jgi:hypothetical protein
VNTCYKPSLLEQGVANNRRTTPVFTKVSIGIYLGQSATRGPLTHTLPQEEGLQNRSPVGNEQPTGMYVQCWASAASQVVPRRGRVAGQPASGTVQRQGGPASPVKQVQVPPG